MGHTFWSPLGVPGFPAPVPPGSREPSHLPSAFHAPFPSLYLLCHRFLLSHLLLPLISRLPPLASTPSWSSALRVHSHLPFFPSAAQEVLGLQGHPSQGPDEAEGCRGCCQGRGGFPAALWVPALGQPQAPDPCPPPPLPVPDPKEVWGPRCTQTPGTQRQPAARLGHQGRTQGETLTGAQATRGWPIPGDLEDHPLRAPASQSRLRPQSVGSRRDFLPLTQELGQLPCLLSVTV